MTLDSRIVEYLENGKFICAFVTEDIGNRLHLLNQNSRELNLPRNRIIHSTTAGISPAPSRQETIDILQKTAQLRAELAETIKLDEIWEVVSEKHEEILGVDFLAGLFFGQDPSDDQCAAFLRAILANRLYFKYKDGSIQIHSPETVAQITLKLAKEAEQEQFIASNTAALSHIWNSDGPVEDWQDQETTLALLADYYLFDKEATGHELARKLVKAAGLTGPDDIFNLLVKSGIWDENENIPLLRQQLPTSFSDAALAELRQIVVPEAAEMVAVGRKDFRNLEVLTIDGPATRDFDDGLHIEKQDDNYLVGIHISDVGLFVKQGSALFDEALQRGTSLYFPEQVIPMLPPELSEDKLSLLKDQERPALSFLILLSPKAEVIRYEIVHSVVSVHRQLTYQEVDHLVKNDKDLAGLAALSVLLRQRRVNNGALLLPIPELNIKIGENGTLSVNRFPVDTPSRILVAEFMILANIIGAQFIAEREAPGLFRCQAEPRQRLIDGHEKDILKVIQQRKRLSPMALLTTPKNHSGIGAPQYTTITSPLRRLLDLVMQLQISHLVSGKGILFSKRDMKHYGAIILSTLEKANQVKFLRQRYWILKYLEKKAGERIPALVIESGPKRVHIFLEEFQIDADLPLNPSFKVTAGDIVLVRLVKVDPLRNILRLDW